MSHLARRSMSGEPMPPPARTSASVFCYVRSALPRFLAAIFATSFSIAPLLQFSAIITGEQYRVAAVLLIHSFSEQRTGFEDYDAFVRLFGVHAHSGVVQRLPTTSIIPIFAVWVTGDCSFLKS